MDPVLSLLGADDRRLVRRRAMPDFCAPMLATLAKQGFSDPAWVFEPKLDGQRSLLWKRGEEVRLLTRNKKDRTSHYPDLLGGLGRHEMAPSIIADGEIVAFSGGIASFSRLQQRMQNSQPSAKLLRSVPVVLYLFDLIWIEGYEISALPLVTRKALLRHALDFEDPIRYCDHLDTDGETAFRTACQKGWEGLIAKRANSPYIHGRSTEWLKLKCVNEQEFVVLGWTDPHGARAGLGALLVGYRAGKELRFAGKVGTGFAESELVGLTQRLALLDRSEPPLKSKELPRKGVHWVTPELVVQVGFSEWTDGGRLRHPRYLGIRDDKAPGEVIRESGAK